MKCAIASFAKTPGLSPVKTRLAAEIGNTLSEKFYCMSVDAVEEVLLQVSSKSGNLIKPFWALAEKNGAANSMWSRIPAIWTGNGDLGMRLFNVSRQLFKYYDGVIMTGTDSPQLEPRILADAFIRMNSSGDECIIGPSFDGGFYLFCSSFQVHEYIWTNVLYSRNDTLEQLLHGLKEAGIKYSFLQKMADADTYADLEIVAASLRENREKNLPAQKSLSDWLDDLLAGKIK